SQQEAILQKLLSGCPHIMPLYHSLETIDTKNQVALYQFMPVAGLGSVRRLQEELATLKDNQLKDLIIIHIAKGFLIGLLGMHKEHVYHLDVKSDNLVVSQDGEVSIIDFG